MAGHIQWSQAALCHPLRLCHLAAWPFPVGGASQAGMWKSLEECCCWWIQIRLLHWTGQPAQLLRAQGSLAESRGLAAGVGAVAARASRSARCRGAAGMLCSSSSIV